MREAQMKRQKTSSPPWQRVFEVDYDALARRTAPLPTELSELLRLFDGTRTLRAVVDLAEAGVQPSARDALKRYATLEREKLLTAAGKSAAANSNAANSNALEDGDELVDAWLAEGREASDAAEAAAASTASTDGEDEAVDDSAAAGGTAGWLRWAIAPAALLLAVAAVALLKPAPRATTPAATTAPAVAAANPPATPAVVAPAVVAAAPTAPAAAPPTVLAAAPVVAKDTAQPPEAASAPATVAAQEPAKAAVPAATPASAVAAAPVVAAAKVDAPAAKPSVPAKSDVAVAAKVDAPAAKSEPTAAKAEAPATLVANTSLPAAAKPSAPAAKPTVAAAPAPASPIEKGGATVAAKTSAPVAAAAPAASAGAEADRYQALMAEGKKRYAKGQWKAAQTAYTAALQLDPSRTDALVPLARCQLDSGALDDALGNAKRAIAKRGDDADAWLVVGAVEQQRSHSREARAAYQKYLALAPNAAYAGDVRAVLRTLR